LETSASKSKADYSAEESAEAECQSSDSQRRNNERQKLVVKGSSRPKKYGKISSKILGWTNRK